MWDLIGLIFIFVVSWLLYRFVYLKHAALVDHVPDTGLAVLQRKTVVTSEEKLNPVLVIGRPAGEISFNK